MIKLLIADDEPLICVGVQGLLNWAEFGIEIIGTARNGREAYEIIKEQHPDIVIADIKMPIKNGLELAEECRENLGTLPLFIFLTSYEDFTFARKALVVQAVDYLVKLDLTANVLKASILRALELLKDMKKPVITSGLQSYPQLQDKFFLRLFNNLFDSLEQFNTQKQELKIQLNAKSYIVAYCSIRAASVRELDSESGYSTYSGVLQTLRETLGKKRDCYIISLDLRHFSILFCCDDEVKDVDLTSYHMILHDAFALLYNYFSVQLQAGIGLPIEDSFSLSEGYRSAQRAHRFTMEDTAIVAVHDLPKEETNNEFQSAKIKGEIRKAFEELNMNALHSTLTQIAEYYRAHPTLKVQALDTTCNILYMAISLLPDGEATISQIFTLEPDNYRSIYRMSSVDEITDWLLQLCDGIRQTIHSHKNSYQKELIAEVKQYIKANLDSRLSLNEVAAVFNFSPNYLSKLFSRYSDMGFAHYISYERIQTAKKMLSQGHNHIYEVAEQLGFENAFYFSTVFKKMEGISPREFLNQIRPSI